ncbi:MAG TPA: WecB/TagA/CpsF family glycosyltransferase [Gemmatimonadales bacterium]|nr:WecB/TagA/CpsF family glycosyltransferase [Gemmatimonadales bacterium]
MTIAGAVELPGVRSFRLLGVRVQALSVDALNNAVAAGVRSGERRIIANHNLHSVYLYRRDAKLRAFYDRANLVHVDGMAVILAARLLGLPLRREHRVTYVDWTDPLLAAANAQGWRVLYVGETAAVAERGAAALRRRHPGLVFEAQHGFFDAWVDGADNLAVLRRIHAFEPDVLMVGMGMPRQEHWIYDNLSGLPPCVILSAGAAISYAAGSVPTPPRWAGALCLEWAFRLAAEPRRLWRRYLLEPWSVLGLLLRDLLADSSGGPFDSDGRP